MFFSVEKKQVNVSRFSRLLSDIHATALFRELSLLCKQEVGLLAYSIIINAALASTPPVVDRSSLSLTSLFQRLQEDAQVLQTELQDEIS